MRKARIISRCVFQIIAIFILLYNLDYSQTRRALLVGISNYNSKSISPEIKAPHSNIINLKGPHNDIEAIKDILICRYGFKDHDIMVIEDSAATRTNILDKLQGHLVDKSQPAFFYYSGHGSQIFNSKSAERDSMDETLVPADALKGAQDIRDKELAAIYNKILDKGATLTLIIDCCNSGSSARGYPVNRISRSVAPIMKDIADPTIISPAPEDHGALLIAACQDYQSAYEQEYSTIQHGVLTHALLIVLREAPINESSESLFMRLKAIMQSQDYEQEPVLGGIDIRKKQGLFGEESKTNSGKFEVAVLEFDQDQVVLQGGYAIGIREGCELIRTNGTNEIRLRVTNVKGLSRCEADIIKGNKNDIKDGDVFEINKFTFANDASLKIWMPQSLGFDEIKAVVNDIKSLRKLKNIILIKDPTIETATHILYYDNNEWKLSYGKSQVESLGKNFSSSVLLAKLKPSEQLVKLFINMHPPKEMVEPYLKYFKEMNSVVEFTQSESDANYIMTGRLNQASCEYSLIMPNKLETDSNKYLPLPVRTDWVNIIDLNFNSLADTLKDLTMTLGKIKGWLQLSSPEGVQPFPYHLELVNARTGEIYKNNILIEGDTCSLALIAQENAQFYDQRFIYIFIVDQNGNSCLLFPDKNYGNVENHFPLNNKDFGKTPKKVLLNGSEFIISPPLGTDTYIMLATEEAIPPEVLEFKGVLSKGNESPLVQLFTDVNSGVKSRSFYNPKIWSIEKKIFKSIKK